MKKLFVALLGTMIFTSIQAQDDPLKEYVGVYKFPDSSAINSVDVKLENGVLVGYSTMGSSVLERLAKDTFRVVAYNGAAYFSRNSNGEISGVRIEVQDLILEGKKELGGLV